MEMSNVALECEIEDAETSIRCDENQIQQALVALMVNAMEAMPRGGVLKIAACRDSGGIIQLRVSDTGIGIAEEDLPIRLSDKNNIPISSSLAAMEKLHIAAVLEQNAWNITRSAEALDINRVTLYNKISKYGLKRPG
jgi:DNA-binding NtrC family response regulator